jgi:hypothetical protein
MTVAMFTALMLAFGRMFYRISQGRAVVIAAQAELERAKRCDPMNPNFHPVPPPPKSLFFWRKN